MFASISGVAQEKLFTKERASDEEYKVVVDYLRKNEGRKVGDGICTTLIDSAVYAYSGVPCLDKIFKWANNFDLGQNITINYSEIEKGDMFWILGSYLKDDPFKEKIYHIGIVRRTVGDSLIAVTEQNPNPVKSSFYNPNDYVEGLMYVMKLIPKKQLQAAYKKYLQNNLVANKK